MGEIIKHDEEQTPIKVSLDINFYSAINPCGIL